MFSWEVAHVLWSFDLLCFVQCFQMKDVFLIYKNIMLESKNCSTYLYLVMNYLLTNVGFYFSYHLITPIFLLYCIYQIIWGLWRQRKNISVLIFMYNFVIFRHASSLILWSRLKYLNCWTDFYEILLSHGSQRINCYHFGGSLTFHIAPPLGQILYFVHFGFSPQLFSAN